MKRQYLFYITSLLIFGTNGVVNSFLTLNSTATVFYRTFIGGLFLLAILIIKKDLPKAAHLKGQLLPTAVSGATLGLGWLFLFEAYRHAGVGTSTLLYYLGPAMILAASPFLFGERLTGAKITGILAAFAGMILVNFQSLGLDGQASLEETVSEVTSASGDPLTGVLCGLGSALMYAIMIVANKKVTALEGVQRTFLQLVFAGLVVISYAVITQKPLWPVSANEILPLLILCIVNTGLACYLYFSSMHLLPAQSVAVLSYIDPLSALIFAALFLNESMGPLQMAGAVLILGGAAFGELYRPRRKGDNK